MYVDRSTHANHIVITIILINVSSDWHVATSLTFYNDSTLELEHWNIFRGLHHVLKPVKHSDFS